MNSLKRFLLFAVFLAALLSGCGKHASDSQGAEREEGRINIVTTLFPYYDFARQIAGDKADITMVIPAGMDSHSFEPTPADMLTIQNADVLICNGGEMEHWLRQVLEALDTSEMTVVTMMDYVDTVEEESVEGMEEGTDHGSHAGDDEDSHALVIEYDEHIWTSPVNSMSLAQAIGRSLSEADPQNREYYEGNTAAYLEKLKNLDDELKDVMKNRKRDMIIVGDKFPFRYLADEYGLRYRAAFSGCSTDTEPSAQTIAYLIDKVRKEEIPVIFYLELSSSRVSEIIAEETGAKPLLLHSCHNVTRKEFDGGITYLQLMRQNVENLRKGLDE